jgi:hypothetical protein
VLPGGIMFSQGKPEEPRMDRNEFRKIPVRIEFASRSRPLGVTLIALRDFLGVAASLILIWLLGSNTGGPSNTASILGTLTCLLMLSALLGIFLGFGLWRMRPWARITQITFSILSIIFSAFLPSIGGGQLLGALVDCLIVFYLLQPRVGAAF